MKQREIKFKVWGGKNMYYPAYPLQTSNCDELGNACIVQGLDKCSYIELDSIILESTGLLDRKGKEIYEGDIVGIPSRPEYKCRIVNWNTFLNWGTDEESPKEWLERMTIVGNIFEHKNLLNE